MTGVLPSLQFTDFHKFLVSVGGLACVAAGALPLLLLRTQKTVSVTTKQLGELTEDARSATEVQQSQLLWLLHVWPWISAGLLLVGVALVLVGAVIWRRRQDVLNSKDDAEIKKIDAEREKAYQESVALSKSNRETLKETELALEEKAAESESNYNSAAESMDEEAKPAPTSGATLAALQTILSASEALPPEARGLIRVLSNNELLLQAFEREFPDADIVRNVRIGKERADFVVTTRIDSMPSLIVDVSRLPRGLVESRKILERRREWADQIAVMAPSLIKREVRPVVVLVASDEMHPEKVSALSRLITEILREDDATHAAMSVILIANSALEKKYPILGMSSAPNMTGPNSSFAYIP
jgi:hypothetical protein